MYRSLPLHTSYRKNTYDVFWVQKANILQKNTKKCFQSSSEGSRRDSSRTAPSSSTALPRTDPRAVSSFVMTPPEMGAASPLYSSSSPPPPPAPSSASPSGQNSSAIGDIGDAEASRSLDPSLCSSVVPAALGMSFGTMCGVVLYSERGVAVLSRSALRSAVARCTSRSPSVALRLRRTESSLRAVNAAESGRFNRAGEDAALTSAGPGASFVEGTPRTAALRGRSIPQDSFSLARVSSSFMRACTSASMEGAGTGGGGGGSAAAAAAAATAAAAVFFV